jgi:hypothetical protein
VSSSTTNSPEPEEQEELQLLLERVRAREHTALKRAIAYSLPPIIIAVFALGGVIWGIKVAADERDVANHQLKVAEELNRLSKLASEVLISFNYPRELRLGEASVIVLLVKAPEGLVVTGAQMEAELSGSGFIIEAITPQTQALPEDGSVEWRWQIKPTKAGIQRLLLTHSTLLWIEGEQISSESATFVAAIEITDAK